MDSVGILKDNYLKSISKGAEGRKREPVSRPLYSIEIERRERAL
jgi:hypothetical protein